MIRKYLFIIALLANLSFGQDSRIFDNYWFLTDVIENGVSHIPPTTDMGISFDSEAFNAYGCNCVSATVIFENNITNFSAKNYMYCLSFCATIPPASYQDNHYFPFLDNNLDPNDLEYFTYNITDLLGVKTLSINSNFNKQAIYSSVSLANNTFEKTDFRLYPNPSNEFVVINLNDFYNNSTKVEFIDQIGSLCKTVDLLSDKAKIDIKDLPSGIYFVKIKLNDKVIIKKLIKE